MPGPRPHPVPSAAMPIPATYSGTSPSAPWVNRAPNALPTANTMVVTISERAIAASNGPTNSDERGAGVSRMRS